MRAILVVMMVAGCATEPERAERTAEAAAIDPVVQSCADLECNIVECVTCYLCNGMVQDPPSTVCRCSWWGVPSDQNPVCISD